MLAELRHILSVYEIVPITEDNYNDVLEVYETNQDFFLLTEGKRAELSDILSGITAVPEGFNLSDKHFVGIWRDGSIVAVLDLLVGFPDPNCVLIGLLLVHGGLKGRGIGTEIAKSILRASESICRNEVRLGVIDKNTRGIDFWTKMGFEQVGKSTAAQRGIQLEITIFKYYLNGNE